MSAFCDIALALGLTFGGTCVADAPPSQALPEDDEAAWSLPAPPPPPPTPAMPPIIIEKRIEVPSPPALPPPVPEKPSLQPLEDALERAWKNHPALPKDWDQEIITEDAAKKARGEVLAPLSLPPDPLDLAAPTPEEDYKGPRRTSSRPVDNARILTADRYITGILETGVNSQVGGDEDGTIIIQTARDVFGYHGRHVLLPKGSRLICSFRPPADAGASRLALNCSRVLIAGHRAEILGLEAMGGNAQGQAGVSGDVDRRFWERYGTAFLLAGISTAVRFGSASIKSNNNQTGSATESAAEKSAEELSQRFGEISASVLEQTLSLTPIITIPQGTRVQIRPAVDWYIARAG